MVLKWPFLHLADFFYLQLQLCILLTLTVQMIHQKPVYHLNILLRDREEEAT